jgi:hypothetical protein
MRWVSGLREQCLTWFHDHSGVAAAFTVVTIAALLGFAALVVDVGHIVVARSELQNAADAAALAGARGYFPPAPPTGTPVSPDPVAAKAAATSYVNQNYADTQALTIASDDIQPGVWHWGTPGYFEATNVTYVHNSSTILAIQVTVRKNAVSNNPVAMTLAQVLGIPAVDAQATAVAVNELPLASNQLCEAFIFAIPECIPNAACAAGNHKYPVRFSNDPNDTAGWASFTSPVSASSQKCLAQLLALPCGGTAKGCGSGDCQPAKKVTGCPGGTSVYTQNGVDNSVIQALRDTLQAWTEVCKKPLKLLVPVVLGGAGTNCTGVKWTGTKCLTGYAEMIIDPNDPIYPGYVNPGGSSNNWYPPGNGGAKNEIQGYIRCVGDSGKGQPGPPGTGYFGTVSLVPKLAQ